MVADKFVVVVIVVKVDIVIELVVELGIEVDANSVVLPAANNVVVELCAPVADII